MNINDPTSSMSSITTARSHFPPWNSARSPAYAEFPPNAGKINETN